MKSARDWDRTGLAGGPVTSPSRLAAPRLHNRARRAPLPTTFRLRFPEGPLVCAEARQVQPNSLCGSGDGRAVLSLLTPGINLRHLPAPHLQARPRLPGRAAWGAADRCVPIAFVRSQPCSGALLKALRGPECRAGGRAGSPRGWAEPGHPALLLLREARGVPPRRPRPARVFQGRLRGGPAAATGGVGCGTRGARVRAGCAERLAPSAPFALPPAISAK